MMTGISCFDVYFYVERRSTKNASKGHTMHVVGSVFWSSLPAWLLRHVHGRWISDASGGETHSRLSNDSLRLRQQPTRTLRWKSRKKRNLRRWQATTSSSKFSYNLCTGWPKSDATLFYWSSQLILLRILANLAVFCFEYMRQHCFLSFVQNEVFYLNYVIMSILLVHTHSNLSYVTVGQKCQSSNLKRIFVTTDLNK